MVTTTFCEEAPSGRPHGDARRANPDVWITSAREKNDISTPQLQLSDKAPAPQFVEVEKKMTLKEEEETNINDKPIDEN